jgi:hypothetical protein
MEPEKKNRLPEDDDGRTIANMNVDGMPWYDSRLNQEQNEVPGGEHYQMTKEEQRMYTWAAIKSGLLVALVFAVVFGLFLAFCDFVWFR